MKVTISYCVFNFRVRELCTVSHWLNPGTMKKSKTMPTWYLLANQTSLKLRYCYVSLFPYETSLCAEEFTCKTDINNASQCSVSPWTGFWTVTHSLSRWCVIRIWIVRSRVEPWPSHNAKQFAPTMPPPPLPLSLSPRRSVHWYQQTVTETWLKAGVDWNISHLIQGE